MLIRAITKSNKKVLDKYTVYFFDGSYLTLSHNPDPPQGVSQWGEIYNISDSHFEQAAESKDHRIPGTDEVLINFIELPAELQSHIEKRIADSK